MNKLPCSTIPFMLALLAACQRQQSPEQLQSWIAQTRQLAEHDAATPQPAPMTTPFQPLPYLMDGSTTPFGAQRSDPLLTQQRPPQRGPRQPLEDFALEALQLMGSLSRATQHNALILAGSTLYRVRVGDYLGPHFGQVKDISAQGLVLQKLRRNANGSWDEQQVLLPFPGGQR